MMQTIYVELFNEGTICYRPVDAIKLSDGRYKVISIKTDEDEVWAFNTNDIVECEMKEIHGNFAEHKLVAVKRYEEG